MVISGGQMFNFTYLRVVRGSAAVDLVAGGRLVDVILSKYGVVHPHGCSAYYDLKKYN